VIKGIIMAKRMGKKVQYVVLTRRSADPAEVGELHQVVSELIFVCIFQAKEIKETKKIKDILYV
jgi:hypothetical protein